jgi:DNA end-binding protein Ku
LREVIDAKLAGEGIEPEPEPEERGNVIDLMAALKQSLGEKAKPAPARKKAASRKRG